MRKFLLLGTLIAANAMALPILTVTPTLGPDFGFNSSSAYFDAWAANVIQGLQTNQTSVGSGITGYTAISNGATIAGNEFIATPFTSWQGGACSTSCLYDTEYGAAMYFALHITTQFTTDYFTLEQLSVAETYLGQASGYPAGTFTDFSGRLAGRLVSDGSIVNSGASNNALLSELWYVGVGFVQGLDPNATGTEQERINATWNSILGLADRTTQVCYSLPKTNPYHDSVGCGSVTVPSNNPVPEPGAMFLLGGGLAALALLRRRSA